MTGAVAATTGAFGDDCVMWEARAADGKLGELLSWVDAHAVELGQVFSSEQPDGCRVVVIAAEVGALAAVPAELIARPPQAWSFSRVPRPIAQPR